MNPASVLDHAPLEAVHIYFDTATYDEIERDEKVIYSTDLNKSCLAKTSPNELR